ncbi:MAG: 2-hydroxyacid dehydrogenase [Litorilinea sp.]
MPKVLFLTSLAPDIAAQLTGMAPADYEVETHSIDADDATQVRLLADADFVILFPGHLRDGVIQETVAQQPGQLKLIQLVSAGFDRVNVELCRELGIGVANNGGTNSIDVAEHTLCLMLAVYRRLIEMDQHVRNGGWRDIDSGNSTYTLFGKTVGIVGMGNIGRETAKRLQGFGTTVLYVDAFPARPEVESALNVQRVELDELLARADVVTLHVPLNDATHTMISGRELAMMKSEAILINTCRGPVVDEVALAEALQAGQIRGAGLDVLIDEPPAPTNRLLNMPNVILTPHSAGVTYDTWARRGEFIFANLQRVWRGETARALVN